MLTGLRAGGGSVVELSDGADDGTGWSVDGSTVAILDGTEEKLSYSILDGVVLVGSRSRAREGSMLTGLRVGGSVVVPSDGADGGTGWSVDGSTVAILDGAEERKLSSSIVDGVALVGSLSEGSMLTGLRVDGSVVILSDGADDGTGWIVDGSTVELLDGTEDGTSVTVLLVSNCCSSASLVEVVEELLVPKNTPIPIATAAITRTRIIALIRILLLLA
mmetsp:Transcript_25685/g.42746  ORF Transcript_25685/g.42746 Transcript_25685/m.42746 type:complete len:219 (-) Transcript_25685:97-753(-)